MEALHAQPSVPHVYHMDGDALLQTCWLRADASDTVGLTPHRRHDNHDGLWQAALAWLGRSVAHQRRDTTRLVCQEADHPCVVRGLGFAIVAYTLRSRSL